MPDNNGVLFLWKGIPNKREFIQSSGNDGKAGSVKELLQILV